ncbi:Probable serine incorporator [Linum perenne]
MDLDSMDREDLDSIEAGSHHINPSSIVPLQGVAVDQLQPKRFDYSMAKRKSLRARYVYCIIFLITNLKAWFFRDYGQQVLSRFNCELARVGAGVFLVLQLVSVIEFITWWNNYWMPDEGKNQNCSFGLFMSTIIYIASFSGILGMYIFYGHRLECALNIFFITWTAVLLTVMMAISLHSKVNRGLLSTGIMASYLIFLCWSAIRSEPASDKCNNQTQTHGKSDWTTIVSFLIAIGAIVMATFSTGMDSKSFQFRKEEMEEEDDIPYDYGFFHLVFALGAMYFAMLFISWNLKSSATK